MYWVLIFLLFNSNYHASSEKDLPFSSVFKQFQYKLEENSINVISIEEWNRFVKLGLDSVKKQNSFEKNLLAAKVTVQNGSISHTTLLDTLPEEEAKADSEFAKKMLKISQYIYNSKCGDQNINESQCLYKILNQPLPADSELLEKCINITTERRNGHYSFRRLLPKNYKDGLYQMLNAERLPSPRLISDMSLKKQLIIHNSPLNNDENLILVQWTQFIEHDLSKPVATSMANGYSIDCCNNDNYSLQPRHHHPACSPILSINNNTKGTKKNCINYVRSALVVGPACTFAALEQVNHATSSLDLSQLYGFTVEDQQLMRLYKDGQLNSSKSSKGLFRDFLPIPDNYDLHEFCAMNYEESQDAKNYTCFMAGDSRVNSNPFTIVIYTIFMRNHNQIAQKLKIQRPNLNDEELFGKAKAINIDIYRRIIFNEWLPSVLGNTLATKINAYTMDSLKQSNEVVNEQMQISNEFAVAAIRFYISMMPNVLQKTTIPTSKGNKIKRSSESESKLFVIKDQIYKPTIMNSTNAVNVILESLLYQSAMKMDSAYVESFVLNAHSHPTHADILAIDIQRGRDHGLQNYVMYLEVCQNIKINDWKDLEGFITVADINDLKTLYKNWKDIDLIVGGIAEIPQNGSVVGPTFSCILAEQFEQIKRDQLLNEQSFFVDEDIKQFQTITAFDVLCSNSDLNVLPKNIYHLVSERNPLVPCAHKMRV